MEKQENKQVEEQVNTEPEVLEMNPKKEKKEKKKGKEQKLMEELSLKDNEIKELTEKVKLAQAEVINYRKRKDEETASLLKYANQELIMNLLQIVDGLERAISQGDKQESEELSKFLTGIKMVYANLLDVLKQFGVEEVNRVGEVFDPNQEQALLTESHDELEDEVVIEVLLKGYKLKDRVIRPASVKINQK